MNQQFHSNDKFADGLATPDTAFQGVCDLAANRRIEISNFVIRKVSMDTLMEAFRKDDDDLHNELAIEFLAYLEMRSVEFVELLDASGHYNYGIRCPIKGSNSNVIFDIPALDWDPMFMHNSNWTTEIAPTQMLLETHGNLTDLKTLFPDDKPEAIRLRLKNRSGDRDWGGMGYAKTNYLLLERLFSEPGDIAMILHEAGHAWMLENPELWDYFVDQTTFLRNMYQATQAQFENSSDMDFLRSNQLLRIEEIWAYVIGNILFKHGMSHIDPALNCCYSASEIRENLHSYDRLFQVAIIRVARKLGIDPNPYFLFPDTVPLAVDIETELSSLSPIAKLIKPILPIWHELKRNRTTWLDIKQKKWPRHKRIEREYIKGNRVRMKETLSYYPNSRRLWAEILVKDVSVSALADIDGKEIESLCFTIDYSPDYALEIKLLMSDLDYPELHLRFEPKDQTYLMPYAAVYEHVDYPSQSSLTPLYTNLEIPLAAIWEQYIAPIMNLVVAEVNRLRNDGTSMPPMPTGLPIPAPSGLFDQVKTRVEA